MKDIKHQLSDCMLLGDKGYLSADVKLETPKRINQKDYKPQFYLFKTHSKRIETLCSQLCDQFMIRSNYAKCFQGYKTRILSKLIAVTFIQYLNKFKYNKNINNLKINLT